MTRIIVKDRRFHSNTRRAYKTVASFEAKNIQPQTVIPEYLLNRWKADRNVLGYATFRGFTEEEATRTFALTKGAKILLSINRFGDILGYKILEVQNENRKY